MANAEKGEVDFVVGPKAYTMKFGNNAKAEAERALGRTWRDIVGELLSGDDMRVDTARTVIWAGLRQHHPQLSLIDVGDMIDDAGDEYAGTRIGEALKLMAPKNVAAGPPQEPK